MRFREFYYLNENIFKRKEIRDSKEILKKYFNHPTAMVSFRDPVVQNIKGETIHNNPLVGINPKSKYNTPNGIYGYPIKEIKDLIEKWNIPFASAREYAVVYKPKDGVPILRTSTFSKEDLEEKKKLIAEKYFSNNIDFVEKIIDYYIDPGYKKSPAQILWSLTREMAKTSREMSKIGSSDFDRRTLVNPNKWAKILVDIGVPVFIDDKGEGTIHSAEKIQSVIFGRNFVDIIDTFKNRHDVFSELEDKMLKMYRKIRGASALNLEYFDFENQTLKQNGIVGNTISSNASEEMKIFFHDWKIKNNFLSKIETMFPKPLSIKISLIDQLYYFIRKFSVRSNLKYSFSDYSFEKKYLSIKKEEIYENEKSFETYSSIFNVLWSAFNHSPEQKIAEDLIIFVLENADFEDPKTFNSIYGMFGYSAMSFIKDRMDIAIKNNPTPIADEMVESIKRDMQLGYSKINPSIKFKLEFIKNHFPNYPLPSLERIKKSLPDDQGWI